MTRALGLLEQGPDDGEAWSYARARLLMTRAFSEFEMHGSERGEMALDAATAAAALSGRRDLDALVHELRGLIAVRSGRLDLSLAELDASVGLLRYLDPEDRPILLLNRGGVHLLRRDLRSARADLDARAAGGRPHGLRLRR